MPTREELVRYADVALEVGLGPVDGRRLTIRSHVEAADLVRVVVERAYERGHPRVDVVWNDPGTDVVQAVHGGADAVRTPAPEAAALNAAATRGDAYLRIGGGDFPTLEGDARGHYATLQATWRAAIDEMSKEVRSVRLPWSIVCYPTRAWAEQVFPGQDDAVDQLWAAIARVSRLDEDDPVAAWWAHATDLSTRAEHVTGLGLVELRYAGPGTDLTVGVAGRLWVGGISERHRNVPNLPTEEVFTSPDCHRVDGTLALTQPYVFGGESIEGAVLRFVDGVVTEATCRSGQEALDTLLDTDDGARRVGEVALVPHSSRIAREQLQWHHVLYQENEDCHLALGASYPFTAPGAVDLDEDGQLAMGVNHSRVHEDVVVGSAELDVVGIDADGTEHPLLTQGEWGFEVG